MLDELGRLAAQPTVAELMDEVERRKRQSGVVLDPAEILADRDAERA